MKVSGISPDKLFSNINTLNRQSSKLHNHVKEQDHNVLSIMDNASCCSVSSIQHRQLSSSNKLICGSSFLDETKDSWVTRPNVSLLWCQSYAAEAYRAIFSDELPFKLALAHRVQSGFLLKVMYVVQAILFKHSCAEEKVHYHFKERLTKSRYKSATSVKTLAFWNWRLFKRMMSIYQYRFLV